MIHLNKYRKAKPSIESHQGTTSKKRKVSLSVETLKQLSDLAVALKETKQSSIANESNQPLIDVAVKCVSKLFKVKVSNENIVTFLDKILAKQNVVSAINK